MKSKAPIEKSALFYFGILGFGCEGQARWSLLSRSCSLLLAPVTLLAPARSWSLLSRCSLLVAPITLLAPGRSYHAARSCSLLSRCSLLVALIIRYAAGLLITAGRGGV